MPISISACRQSWTIFEDFPSVQGGFRKIRNFLPKKGKFLIVDIDVDTYRYNPIYIASLRPTCQNSHLRRTARNCPCYRATNQRRTHKHHINISSSAMKTLILLIIIFPVLLARILQHKVRSTYSNSYVACLSAL